MKSSDTEKAVEEKFQVINMCDFCSKEIETCQASPVRVRELQARVPLDNPSAVVACDKYESPVDVLETRFR